MSDEKKQALPNTSVPQLTFTRTADFSERYANNVRFESSVWDLKTILGTLDQTTTPPTIHVHGSITIPWAQAKLMAYFLQLHVFFHETGADGEIKIPENLLPPRIEEAIPEMVNQPGGPELLERIKRLRADLFGQK